MVEEQAVGGISYGTCMTLKRGCMPCNPRDENDAAWIIGKCRQVPECTAVEDCTLFADLASCCGGSGRCGNAPAPDGPGGVGAWQNMCERNGYGAPVRATLAS
jgi:hypothetical protein